MIWRYSYSRSVNGNEVLKMRGLPVKGKRRQGNKVYERQASHVYWTEDPDCGTSIENLLAAEFNLVPSLTSSDCFKNSYRASRIRAHEHLRLLRRRKGHVMSDLEGREYGTDAGMLTSVVSSFQG